MKTGLVYDEIYLKHDTGSHPENWRRLKSVEEGLKDYGIWDKLLKIEPYAASVELVETTHEGVYIKRVRDFVAAGGGSLDPDTVVSADSYNAALMAAGGACAAVDAVMADQVDNAFVLSRPPGHHAEKARAMGFCLFNNVAIAANYAMDRYKCRKVMIIDWDAHHGNGTQKAFYSANEVLYLSTHQQGLFPGTGRVSETGSGEGEGYNINIPLARNTGDSGFYYAFKQVCQPVLRQFEPDLVLISCGFDAHHSDPLAGLDLTVQGYKQITDIVMEAVGEGCNKVVAILEGGYNLGTLGSCAAAVVSSMAGLDVRVEEPGTVGRFFTKPQMRVTIDEVLAVQRKYWAL